MATIRLAKCPQCKRVHGEWNIALTSAVRICRHCRCYVTEEDYQKSLIAFTPERADASFRATLEAAVEEAMRTPLHQFPVPPATPIPTRSRVEELIALVREQMGDQVADALLSSGTDRAAIEAALSRARHTHQPAPPPVDPGPLGKRKIKL